MTDSAKLCECGHPEEAHTFDRRIPASPRDTCHATIHVGIGTHKHPGVYSYPCPCKRFVEAVDAAS